MGILTRNINMINLIGIVIHSIIAWHDMINWSYGRKFFPISSYFLM